MNYSSSQFSCSGSRETFGTYANARTLTSSATTTIRLTPNWEVLNYVQRIIWLASCLNHRFLPAMAVVLLGTLPCHGDVIYQTGFERSDFTNGLLNGQDEWLTLIGIADVSDVAPKSGTQSIEVDGAELVGPGLLATISSREVEYDTVAHHTPVIDIRVDVRLDGPSTDTGRGEADDLISANIAAYTGDQPNGVRPVSQFLLSSSGEVFAAGQRGSEFEGPGISLGQYHNLGLRLDFLARETEFFLDGASIGVGPFDPSVSSNVFRAVQLQVLAVDDSRVLDPWDYTAFYDNVTITAIGPQPDGDFNGNEMLDSLDIDLLSEQVRGMENNPVFDLNSDGFVNDEDRTIWVQDLAGTFFGDADLNKEVQFSDFLALSGGFAQAGGWARGDFDGSGDVQFPDFLLLANNFGRSNQDVAAIPEPASIVVGVIALGSLVMCSRRRRRNVS